MKRTPWIRLLALAAVSVTLSACEDAEDPDASCRELASGEVCTWLGLVSEPGFNGDGHHRRETRVNEPQDLIFLDDGTVWFSDFNNFQIRRVHPDGEVETMVGSVDPVFPGDGPLDGIPAEGAPGLDWMLNHPTNMLVRDDGTVVVVGWHNHKLLLVDPDDGFVRRWCGSGAGFAGDGQPAADAAKFIQINDASFDEDGNIYILDQQNERIRVIDTDGIITTIAGDGMVEYSGDGGPAIDARFSFAKGSNPNPSGGLLYHEGKVYIADTEVDVIRVIDLSTGMIDRFAGTGEEGDSGEGGPALEAKLNAPRDLEIGPEGDLYFVDTDNGKVKAVDLVSGDIRTVVGTGELGVDEDGLMATETRLRRPFGLAFDPDDDLFVMDSLNSRVIKVAR